MQDRLIISVPLLITLLAPLAPLPARAQQSYVDETTAIMAAAAVRVRSELPAGSALVDVDLSLAAAPTRAATITKTLKNAQPGKLNRVCSGDMLNTCHLRGADLVLQVMAPVVRGNTAQVLVRVWQETKSKRQPVHSSALLVKLIRNGNSWVAVDSRMNSES